MTEAPPIADAPPDWDAYLRHGFVRLLELLLRPPPEALAAGKGLLTRAEARAAAAWLRPLELIVRLLLAWTVLLMPGAAPAPWRASSTDRGRPSPRGRGGERRPPGFALWGGSSGPPGFSGGAAPSADGQTLVSAWRLVARLEAALAVVEDPAPCLARLARRWGRIYWGRPSRPRPPAPKTGVSGLARPWLVAEAEALVASAAAFDTG